jgi:hypothetical protein
MDNIFEATVDYDFSKLYLGPPTTVPGGAYFTRLMYNTNKPLYIQTPKSLTKQGFVKSGKKVYTDLMFDNNDTVFINWIENLENTCQELIFSKGQTWFETKLEKDDIESAFTSPFKIFKSGKYYLLRINVKPNIKIYNENDQIITIDDVSSETNIISIIEIQGIRFTSRNFQIDFELKQAMLVSPDPFLDECFIKKPNRTQPIKEETTITPVPVPVLEETKPVLEDANPDLEDANPDLEDANPDLEDANPDLEDSNPDLEEFDINAFINETSKDLDKIMTQKNHNETVVSFNLPNSEITKPNSEKTKPNSEIAKPNSEIAKPNSEIAKPNSEIAKPNNINLEIIELEIQENPNILQEVDLSLTLEKNAEPMTLKKPNQVYYEIYEKAREKAKEAKRHALQAYLEMKNIKKTYMLDDIDDSDSESEMDNSSDEEDLDDSY